MPRYKSLDDLPASMRAQAAMKLAAQGVRVERAVPIRGTPDLDPCMPPKRAKYGNVRTEFNGETYDSKAEAEDEQRFALMQASGEIGGYARQVTIPLRGATRKRGSRAKFDWLVNEPRPHACSKCGHVNDVMCLMLKDTKGIITAAWETKRRLIEAQLGIRVEVIQH